MGGTFQKNGNIPDVGNFGFGVDLRSGLLLRLWRAGVALAQAIGTISSLCPLYARRHGSWSKSAPIVMIDNAWRTGCRMVVMARPDNHVRLG